MLGYSPIYYRDLLANLIVREVSLRYRRSVLGVLWSLINPLLSMLIFVFVFQGVFKIIVPNYPVYVFSGQLAWNWFSASLSAATFTLFQGRDLVRKPAFPTEVLVLVTVSSNLVNYLLALPILFVLMLATGVHIDASLLLLPPILALQFLFTAGLCFFLSVLNVYFRDVEHLVAIGVGLWFYVTPIFYKPADNAPAYQAILALNPMAQLTLAYRGVFLTHQFPEASSLVRVTLIAIGSFVLGLLFFRRYKAGIVDEL